MNSKAFNAWTRNVVSENYALITPDGYVVSVLPGWSRCKAHVLISGAMKAQFSQWLIELEEGATGAGPATEFEHFFYVLAGAGTINGVALRAGGFCMMPPRAKYEFASMAEGTRLLVFRKRYEALDGTPPQEFMTVHQDEVEALPFLGDPRARLQTLIPDSARSDMAVNIFTYEPGATLPFIETHVMEHGMLFLEGAGVYRLGEDWHPVRAGDAIWIAPYCPQWFIAAGPGPARYIYYKDVNRIPG